MTTIMGILKSWIEIQMNFLNLIGHTFKLDG